MPLRERVSRYRDRVKLSRLSDDALDARVAGLDWDDQRQVAAVMREVDRRDRARAKAAAAEAKATERAERATAAKARAKDRRRQEAQEHALYAEDAYLAAEEATRGNMLSKAGKRANFDPKRFWEVNEATAQRYASEELRNYWEHGGFDTGRRSSRTSRLTLSDFRRERARERQDYEDRQHLYPGVPY